MCLIRQDLTTVWCEVTSSVRTRLTDEESFDSPSNPSKSSASPPDPVASREDRLEILLCLRPISNGEKNVDESFRFIPLQRPTSTAMDNETIDRVVSSSSANVNKTESSSGSVNGPKENSSDPQISSEKRKLPTDEETSKPQSKKQKRSDGSKPSTLETEQAVETLMFLNKSSQ